MRFALITEGVSENRIIKQVVARFFKEHEVFFHDAQPQIINNKQNTIGGWNEVLKYCDRKEDLKEIFIDSDYLIIQIDTDLSQNKSFGISHNTAQNVLKTCDELHYDIHERLLSLIDADFLKINQHRILFAICIHSIECWLLPLHFSNHHTTDTTNCFSTLNSQLRKQNYEVIPKDKNSVKAIRAYNEVLKAWKKKEDILNSAKHNCSFKKFLESLDKIIIGG